MIWSAEMKFGFITGEWCFGWSFSSEIVHISWLVDGSGIDDGCRVLLMKN